MATTSSLGIGAGVDLASMLSSLIAAERQPINVLTAKVQASNTKLSTFSKLKSALSTLQTAADKLSSPLKLSPLSATASDTTKLSATAAFNASAGSYAVSVTQLAAAQKSFSNEFSTSPTSRTFGQGSLTFTIDGDDYDIDLSDQTTYTLQDVRAKINAADIGVTATVVTGSTGERLILTGKEGAANAFTLAATTTGPGAATNDLADIAVFDTDGSDDVLARSTAADALLTIDGVAVTSSGNVVENALNGVSLKLLATGSTTLTVATDNSKISDAVKSLVDAYNAINTLIKENSTYDTATKTAKPLNGESSVRTIQSILTNTRTSIPAALSSATYKTLSEVGVSIQKDGSLTIDSAKLTAALTSSSSSVQTTLAAYGTAFNDAIASMLDTGGVLESRVSGLNASIKSYNDRKTSLEFRVENIEKRYRAQFTALDKLVSSMQTTSNYLTQQLSALSK